MSPVFSSKSQDRLATCRRELQDVMNEAIKHYDFSVIYGFRGQKDQDDAVAAGNSRLPWPMSRHNRWPSEAVDIAPYPINWENEKEFYYLAGFIMGIAAMKGIKLKWGGRWKNLVDTPHFELDDGN